MEFTGSDLTLKRSLYTQNDRYGYAMSCTVDNTTGRYSFGLSGAGGTLEFKLESGRLYYANQFLHTYQSFQAFTLEGDFTSGTLNIVKDGAALMFGAPKATGAYDSFYFKRENAGMLADFDLNVSGSNTPTYAVQNIGYLVSSGQNAVTGTFVNQSPYPIRVFDSSIQATQLYDFGKLVGTIGAGGTGRFAYSGDFTTIDITQPILTNFNTNFSDVSVIFSIVDVRTLSRFVQFTGPSDFTFNQASILNRTLTYLNFSGGFAGAVFPTNLTFSLAYAGGSGAFSSGAGALSYSTIGSGQFLQSGLISGIATTATGSFPVSRFAWATGAVTGYFTGIGTGMASGIGFTGLAVGGYTGRYVGTIFDGSGTLRLDSNLVGVSTGGMNIWLGNGGGTFATGYLDLAGMTEGEDFIINSISGANVRLEGDKDFFVDCNTTGPLFDSIFTTLTEFVQCMSGVASSLGVNGVLVGTDKIYFTSLVAGSTGNHIFLDEDGYGWPGAGFLTGGSDGGSSIIGSGITAPLSPYTGALGLTLTGSGNYQGVISGGGGSIYYKTFTGSWSLATGVNGSSLIQLPESDSLLISGSGNFAPNSQMVFQVTHNVIDSNLDSALLIISGAEVINPISQVFTI